MSTKKLIILIGVLVVLVVVAIVIWHVSSNRVASNAAAPSTAATNKAPPAFGASTGSATWTPTAPAVTVPAKNATNTPPNVATPSIVAPNPVTNGSQRVFNVTFEGGQFTPSTIIANQGDTVHINLTSAGQAFDFTQPDYGLFKAIPAGTTSYIEFNASAVGKFTFFCKSCGGPAQGPVGYIDVVPK